MTGRRGAIRAMALGGSLALVPVLEAGEPRMLRKEIVVEAELDAVWRAWTTADGLKFVSAASRVELVPGGRYEWFVDGPADADGLRGSEGSRVLAFVPREMLAFDWTFPPDVPVLRRSRATTQAAVFFEDLGDGRVRVRLVQHGWGEGADWDAGYAYFDDAWGYVITQLKRSLEGGAATE